MHVALLPVIVSVLVIVAAYGAGATEPTLIVRIRHDVQANAGPHHDWAKRFTLYRDDEVRVFERTQVYEDDDFRRIDTWLRVSRGEVDGWIPAHSVYIDDEQLRRLPQAQIPPFTVSARVGIALTARSAPNPDARTLFSVPPRLPLHVVGRSDDRQWIAVLSPLAATTPADRIGWLNSGLLTSSRARLDELPPVLPSGLAVASVIGDPVSLRVQEHARWDTWAWHPELPSLWFHRLDSAFTDAWWEAPAQLSELRLWNGDWFRTYETEYELSGKILPALVGGSLLVRDHGSVEHPEQPVLILEPDGRTYETTDQAAPYQTDGRRPLSLDALWSPDGRYVLLYFSQSSGRSMILYDRNGQVAHLGFGTRALFHPDSKSIYYVKEDLIHRIDLEGRPLSNVRPIPTAWNHGVQLSADGRYVISFGDTHELVATLTTADGTFIRSWPVDTEPQLSHAGDRVLYALDGVLWVQDLADGNLHKIGQIAVDGPLFAWSPDDAFVAFESAEGLRIASTIGRSDAGGLIVRGQSHRSFRWSPNSRWLAVETPNQRWPQEQLANAPQLSEDGLAWTWSSKQIRVYARDGRLHRIWRVNGGCEDLAWSPDSEWLAYGGPSGCA